MAERTTSDIQAYVEELEQQLKEKEKANDQLRTEVRDLHQQLDEANQELTQIKKSFGWKLSAPSRGLGNLMEKTVVTHKIRKAAHILRHDGWREFKGTYIRFLNVMKQKREGLEEGSLSALSEGLDVSFDAEYQEDGDFTGRSTDVKPLAFYLPQYHPFPENDEWWGKGFTEWVNVRSGEPRFEGHYQPREPHPDFGYYSLLDPEILRKQARLARRHGIYGFVFYYYWFSGKRLMEKPVDLLLQHPEIELPFCLCWANENWTRAWDGKQKDVLISQEYSLEDDQRFIRDMKPYLDDPRYIRIGGKPLIVVYNPGQIPDCHRSFATWREKARELGLGEILIWTCETANNTAESLKILDCIDGIIEFPPHNMWLDAVAVKGLDLKGKSAFIYHYGKLVDYLLSRMKEEQPGTVPYHHGVMLGWDNAARRKDGWFTYCGFSLKALYRWMLAVRKKTVQDFAPEERFCFINAWNEWGEGTYLEPDRKYGYACINTVSKALFDVPLRNELKVFNPGDAGLRDASAPGGIAVQVHMFYLETLEETIANLNLIPFPFDVYVSTDTEEKRGQIEAAMRQRCRAAHVQVQVFENRGRDVAPFLVQMAPVYDRYDLICHIHSKKTRTDDHGNEWRTYIFRHLFGSEENIRHIAHEFEKDRRLGMIMPETYPVLEFQAEWGGNREGVRDLLSSMGCRQELPADPVFPVGNMFWARSEALRPVFDLGLTQRDFPEEAGQVNATIAHQLERCWVYLLREHGYRYLKTFNNCRPVPAAPPARRCCLYAHFDPENRISPEDLKTVGILSAFMDDVFVMSNSALPPEEAEKLAAFGNVTLRQRGNTGMDFGAWRDLIQALGPDTLGAYDEAVLCNNSFFPPVFPLEEMFAEMAARKVDFWGATVFPRLEDGSYLHLPYIPEHLQSYWMVFGKRVLRSECFRNFWETMPDYSDYIDVVAHCESQLTELLSREGFTYDPYIRESFYLSRFLNNYAIPYEKPSSLLLLGSPFIKKKCYQYMTEEERIRLEDLWRAMNDE